MPINNVNNLTKGSFAIDLLSLALAESILILHCQQLAFYAPNQFKLRPKSIGTHRLE